MMSDNSIKTALASFEVLKYFSLSVYWWTQLQGKIYLTLKNNSENISPWLVISGSPKYPELQTIVVWTFAAGCFLVKTMDVCHTSSATRLTYCWCSKVTSLILSSCYHVIMYYIITSSYATYAHTLLVQYHLKGWLSVSLFCSNSVLGYIHSKF